MPGAGAATREIGDVAQLGERLVRNEEVGGSIPLISTILGGPARVGRPFIGTELGGSRKPRSGPARRELVNPVRTGR